MAAQDGTRFVDIVVPLDGRLEQVAQDPRDVHEDGEDGHLPPGHLREEVVADDVRDRSRGHHTTDCSLHRLLGADLLSQLSLSDSPADEVSADVSARDNGQAQ